MKREDFDQSAAATCFLALPVFRSSREKSVRRAVRQPCKWYDVPNFVNVSPDVETSMMSPISI